MDSMTRVSVLSRLVLSCVLAVGLCTVGWAAEGNGYVLDTHTEINAENVPLCKEMLEILNLPENVHAIDGYRENSPVVFPERYKNFKPVEWTPLPLSDIGKHYDMARLQKGLEIIKREALSDKVWDGKGDFLFEEAHVDFDDTGNIITMFRYRLPTLKGWSCILGNDAPPRYFDKFNYVGGDDRPSRYWDCTVFNYGGRIYFSDTSGYGLTVYKPKPLLLLAQDTGVLGVSRQSPALKLYNQIICMMRNQKRLN